ncbi:DUF2225 domain-containing protein [Vallitalea okinawensis]|uniref:DUF2225 domain-containing protein n=1 Tax=Vallitalea okinawensis TaxID=2078660 RepID=UPI000CFD74E7|nr:DUF2225 domain-containing protein [Vallitalea okinawensis]
MLGNIFKGLEKYGLDKTKGIDIYNDGEQIDIEHKTIVEKEALYDKSYICPVCKSKFKDKAVKSSRQRILSIEYDLRPVYDYFEMYKYDVVVCPQCGYGALNSVFTKITPIQAKVIEQKIGTKFNAETYPDIYDYKTSVLRYKLALLNAVLKGAPSIEKAYLCLKLKWLFDVAIESIEDDNHPEVIEYRQQKDNITEQALKGFLDAYLKGHFSSFGFDESKLMYIIGQLYSELGQDKEAYEWFTKVASYAGANFRLRDKARDRREELRNV